ncbi:fungal-specific transcription factor domain-containing protein [Xylariaceae sp. FL1651]|nr:fungal-specific transcription factor domain-containing protein [Xylariaceae sp. FL1651]
MSNQYRDTPSYTGPGTTPRGRARLPSSRRRDKPQLSCNLCRRRKLKCDRQQPCSSCVHRSMGISCTYPSDTVASSDAEKGQAYSQPRNLQERIQQLENLVLDLMQKTAGTPSTHKPREAPVVPPDLVLSNNPDLPGCVDESSPDADLSVSDHGSMKLSHAGASYVSSAHWAAILDGIAELKEHFEKEEDFQHAEFASNTILAEPSGPQLLRGCFKHPDMEDILTSMPSRPVVDRLVSRYFNSFELSPAVLHSVQFLEEYERFWQNPSAVPCVWLGLLFTIMCLAARFQKFRLDPTTQVALGAPPDSDLERMITDFRQRTVQCLILGRYEKGGPYVLEALILYFTSEVFLCKDAEIGIWIVLGIIVQLAMHMGYHRDPKHFKGLSQFAGEMRRRVWATIVELDLGFSAQMGVPRLIKQSQADTSEPRNLQDGDFNMTDDEIPPARPESELTPMLYLLAKNRTILPIGLIWDLVTDIRSHDYAEVMKLDSMLEEAHEAIPTCLKWRSFTHCIMDSPQIIMQKVYLKIRFYNAKIILHRKYLGLSKAQSEYAYSRKSCLAAAIQLLDFQNILDEETQPFCQLYQERWRVSSILNHGFLLATSILCSYLRQVLGDDNHIEEDTEVADIVKYLVQSREIWLRSSPISREALKVSQSLSIVLRNYTAAMTPPPTEVDNSWELQTPVIYGGLSANDQDYMPEFVMQPQFFGPSIVDNWDLPYDEPTGDSVKPLTRW